MQSLDCFFESVAPLEAEAKTLSERITASGATPPQAPKLKFVFASGEKLIAPNVSEKDYEAALQAHVTALREIVATAKAKPAPAQPVTLHSGPWPGKAIVITPTATNWTQKAKAAK